MYSPRSSIDFLACCSNFCKPLKKKIQKVVRPTRSPWQQWPRCRTKNGELSIIFSVQGTGGSPTEPDPENRVGDQGTGSPGKPVSSGLQVPGEPEHCRARTRPPWPDEDSMSRNMSPHLWLTIKLVLFWLNQLLEYLVKTHRDGSNKKSPGWSLFSVVQDEAHHRWKNHHVETGPPSFWRWHTMVIIRLMFLSDWREFPSVSCLAGKKKKIKEKT